jgi:hypothetical protein
VFRAEKAGSVRVGRRLERRRNADAPHRPHGSCHQHTLGSPDATPALRAAVAADPSFGVALAALAMSRGHENLRQADLDELRQSRQGSSRATRRERQHIEIIVTALGGDADRARALGSDHLGEFPGDIVIAHLVARRCLLDDDVPGPG